MGTIRSWGKSFIEFCLGMEGQRILLAKPTIEGGPKIYSVGRLPVRPDVYQSIPLPDRSRSEEPFSRAGNGFVYNSALAQGRWKVLTKLLGAIAVDLKDQLEAFRYQSGEDLSSLGPPVEETNLNTLLTTIQTSSNPDLELEKWDINDESRLPKKSITCVAAIIYRRNR